MKNKRTGLTKWNSLVPAAWRSRGTSLTFGIIGVLIPVVVVMVFMAAGASSLVMALVVELLQRARMWGLSGPINDVAHVVFKVPLWGCVGLAVLGGLISLLAFLKGLLDICGMLFGRSRDRRERPILGCAFGACGMVMNGLGAVVLYVIVNFAP